jgi:hypothetical protein
MPSQQTRKQTVEPCPICAKPQKYENEHRTCIELFEQKVRLEGVLLQIDWALHLLQHPIRNLEEQ